MVIGRQAAAVTAAAPTAKFILSCCLKACLWVSCMWACAYYTAAGLKKYVYLAKQTCPEEGICAGQTLTSV